MDSVLAPAVLPLAPSRPAALPDTLEGAALICLALGESIGGWLSRTWTVWWFSPIFLAGGCLLAIRYVAWPGPGLVARAWHHARAMLARPGVRRSWQIAIGSRLAVLAIGALAVSTIGLTRRPEQVRVSRNVLIDLPARHDAGWYLALARQGYSGVERRRRGPQQGIAFFPAYPAAMHVAGDLVTVPAKVLRDPMLFGGGDARVLWGGVLLSIGCFGLALVRVHRLAMLETASQGIANWTVILLASYPFALFFGAAYSESLFLLALVSTVLAWRQRDPWRGALWGTLAGLSRSNGWTLSIALLLDLALRPRDGRSRQVQLAAALCPLLGAAAFSAFVYGMTGHPLQWVAAQQEWHRALDPWAFVTRRWGAIGDLGLAGYVTSQPVDAITLVVTVIALAAAGVAVRRREWLYAALIAGYLAPALAIDLPATGRLSAVLFPVFLWLARSTPPRPRAALAGLFALTQAYLAVQFFLWKPPY